MPAEASGATIFSLVGDVASAARIVRAEVFSCAAVLILADYRAWPPGNEINILRSAISKCQCSVSCFALSIGQPRLELFART